MKSKADKLMATATTVFYLFIILGMLIAVIGGLFTTINLIMEIFK